MGAPLLHVLPNILYVKLFNNLRSSPFPGRPRFLALIRSTGGWQAVKAFRKNKIHLKGDERVLGDSDFVIHVLNEQNERMERRFRLREQGYDIEKVIDRVSELFSLSKQDIINPSRQKHRVIALLLTDNMELGVYDVTGRSGSWE